MLGFRTLVLAVVFLGFFAPQRVLAQVCGDGAVAGAEECDDGNVVSGDGCDAMCAEEAGWDCVPSLHASGVNPAGAALPAGSLDPHWTWSTSMDRTGALPGFVGRNSAWALLPPGNWITTDATFGAPLVVEPDTFWFQDVFMPAAFAGTLTFSVAVAADNQCEVFVNGVSFGGLVTGFGSATTIAIPASAFVPGANTVMIRLREFGPGSPRGILMYPGGGGILSQCTRVCTGPSDCNDANECTVDSCVSGACLNAPAAPGSACAAGVCTAPLPDSVCVLCFDGGGAIDPGCMAAAPLCDTSGAGPRCVACVDDTTCGGATPRCDVTAGSCVACLSAAHCDDANECTTDACTAGVCGATPVMNGTACAAGLCSSGTCVECIAASDCDDANECTIDACTAGACVVTPVGDGTMCMTGLCASGACTTTCGDGVVAMGVETCDDGNMVAMDGCSATCTVETGWACGCGAPVITYSMEMLAGRIGGDGGGAGPQQGCSGADVLIGLAIDWSNARGEGVRTTTICGSVSVSSGGVVTTTPTTREEQGGSGCGGWDPSTTSAEVICPTGSAIVGLTGLRSTLSGTPTLFDDLSIVCQGLAPDGSAAGPTTTLNIAGGSGAGTMQDVSCPAGQIARFFRTRSGCAQDALDLFCGSATADCGGSASVCGTFCGDGMVGAPVEACDDGGESATCDADCTPAMCGDGTVNAAALETCDDSGESVACDDDCTAAECGDGTLNTMAGESCDDGNTTAGDGCSPTCVSETCGDGVVQGTEMCDDAGESATCDADCTAAMCGDGALNTMAGETCDDTGESATCDTDCTAAMCGDGALNTMAGEACDDGNTTAGDGCSPTCAVEVMPDAGMPDGGRPDAGGRDGGMLMGDGGAPGIDAGEPVIGIAGGACSCRAAGSPSRGGWLALLVGLGLALATRRRRATRTGGAR